LAMQASPTTTFPFSAAGSKSSASLHAPDNA
jgi:hypothetical protein